MKNKKIILIICAVLLIIIALLILVRFYNDNEQKNNANMSIGKLITVNIFGTEGEGYVDIEIDEEYLSSLNKSDGNRFEAGDLRVTISKQNNLKNGDSFTVNISNSNELKEMGMKLDMWSLSFTVSGLKEGTDFDVFSDLKIYIDDGQIVLDNNQCSNFVKDNVEFFIKNGTQSYKVGDTVMVGAYIDMNAATDNGYNIKMTEKEYILSEQENNQ